MKNRQNLHKIPYSRSNNKFLSSLDSFLECSLTLSESEASFAISFNFTNAESTPATSCLFSLSSLSSLANKSRYCRELGNLV